MELRTPGKVYRSGEDKFRIRVQRVPPLEGNSHILTSVQRAESAVRGRRGVRGTSAINQRALALSGFLSGFKS